MGAVGDLARPRRVCVFGAGAVGGQIAVRLAQTGAAVSVVARGAHLVAIQSHGLVLEVPGEQDIRVRLPASDAPQTLGPQDVVVFSVKARDLRESLEAAAPLLTGETRAVFAMNGLPWWFLHGLSVQQTPELAACLGSTHTWRLPKERWIACVVNLGGQCIAPGVVSATTPGENGLCLGYPDGHLDEPIEQFASIARQGGYDVSVSTTIRSALWAKLLVNAGIAAVATMCERSVRATCSDPETRNLAIRVMAEILETGRALRLEPNADPERMTRPERAPDHEPSFLQDLRAGRPLEIDNGILAVRALARAAGVSVPRIETLATLLKARSTNVHGDRGGTAT
ncbi:MAG: 2-dehydropantoate 2-reductase [Burkholderiaceae bacterium]|nr:2-dehydropantoate 2-reductase [Burkholderiaceae bacterium]